jgi:hypothetical protein
VRISALVVELVVEFVLSGTGSIAMATARIVFFGGLVLSQCAFLGEMKRLTATVTL